jgi:MoxR-like ATPase
MNFRLKGPIFANFVLADEINRAPAKVQSARSHAGKASYHWRYYFKLDDHFSFSYAKPIEQEGTYQLPKSIVSC